MTKELWIVPALGAYVLLFIVAVAGIGIWRIKRRREKPPLEFKLLRGPGESLRRRLATFDENAYFRFGGAAFVPIAASGLVWVGVCIYGPQTWNQLLVGVGLMAVAFLATVLPAGRWALGELMRYRDDFLGYLGERAVGEAMVPLIAAGYRVFHDIPAEVGKAKFNVDHVAAGLNGIFAIETKTRRKGRARPGFEAHKVAYDGRQLIWPWAEDNFGLKNAEDRARWLTEWLNKRTGLALVAQPVLVLPGWYVVPKGIGPIIVVNHKQLQGAILQENRRILSEEQIDLIARQLDELCRDVED